MPSLLNQTTSSNSNNEEISVGEHVSTCEVSINKIKST